MKIQATVHGERHVAMRWSVGLALAGALALTTLPACGDDAPDPADTDVALDATPDASTDTASDIAIGDAVYGPTPPPVGPIAEALRGDRWVTHFREDLEGYWTMTEALGTPEGNFPTFRGMDGRVLANSDRRPRMLSRQTYAYAAAYMMTGDRRLLELAHAGVTWLRTRAIDRTRGGCHEQLTAAGAPKAGVRTAQDLSYCVMGLAAYYFVTRDAATENDLLAARGWLFDPARYWDAEAGRIRDALADDMSTEVDVEGDGGWELVAQLDPINAFMLLVQPVLSSQTDRDRFLADLRLLGELLVAEFFDDGIFWGVHDKRSFGTRHVDFGHALKSFWMLLQIDKRLADHPFHDLVSTHVDALVARAYDADNGRWAKRPTSATAVEYGSDWWIYAEADQITATLNLSDHRYLETLANTQANWLTDYVDDRFEAGEVIPGIKRDGSPVWSWSASDNAKCNQWKNGFHSVEHALVLMIAGHHLEGRDVTLHFAVPPGDAMTFTARPYLFDGREVGRDVGETFTLGDRELVEVAVRFRDLY